MTLDGLHGRYAAWFRARLVRRYGAHDAEDILQEAWLRLASYQGLAGIRHPKAFLLRVASNLALGQVRRSATAERFAGATPVVSHEDADQLETVFFRQMVLDLPQPLRDRIVIGEMRDGAAALETLKSWNTGHPGGLSTVHANSATDALRRMEDLIGEVANQVPHRMVGDAVDRVVQIRRTPQGRCVEAVIAVNGSTATVTGPSAWLEHACGRERGYEYG
ncbi:putative RNA polymerase sigma factor FecI [compost metagenome]